MGKRTVQIDRKNRESSKSVNVAHNDFDCGDGDMLSISTTQFVDAWILDSGCSYHITPNRKWFSTYMSVNYGSIYHGDDKCCYIAGISEVKIRMHDAIVTTLGDVRHVPELKNNLIFLGTLHKNDFMPNGR